MANRATQQFMGSLLGLPEGANPFSFQSGGNNIPFSRLIWNIGAPGGYSGGWSGRRPSTGGGGTPVGGGGTGTPPGPVNPNPMGWQFPDYTQDWAFTPPPPQSYPAPPPFKASNYPSSIPTKK